MKIPLWLSQVKLPHKYKPFEGLIVASLRPIYIADLLNKQLRDPCFCVGWDVSFGWPSAIETYNLNGATLATLVNYDDALVRCRFCLFINYKVTECIALKVNQNSVKMPTLAKEHKIGSLKLVVEERVCNRTLSTLLTPIRPTSCGSTT